MICAGLSVDSASELMYINVVNVRFTQKDRIIPTLVHEVHGLGDTA
jgi:hypothetical protein